MKRLSVILTCLLFLATLSAQVNFGVRGGVHLNDISYDEGEIETEGRAGLVLGVFAEINLTDNFAVQPELAFMQKGYTYTLSGLAIDEEYRILTNYIDVPVLAKLKFGDQTGFYLQAGPQFGYAVAQSIEVGGEDRGVELTDNDNYNRGEITGVVGAGISIASFFVDARYNLGLTSLQENDLVFGDSYNRGLTLSAGLKF